MLIIVAIAVVVGASFGFVVAARRRRGDVLDPPAEAPRVTKPTSTAVAEPPDVDEAEVDEALREAVDEAVAPAEAEAVVAEAEAIVAEAPTVPVKPRFRDRLTKARGLLSGYVGSIVGRDKIDEETWDELEEALIRADVGVEPTQELLEHLRERVKDDGLTDGAAAARRAEGRAEGSAVGLRPRPAATPSPAERLVVRRRQRRRARPPPSASSGGARPTRATVS